MVLLGKQQLYYYVHIIINIIGKIACLSIHLFGLLRNRTHLKERHRLDNKFANPYLLNVNTIFRNR